MYLSLTVTMDIQWNYYVRVLKFPEKLIFCSYMKCQLLNINGMRVYQKRNIFT